MTIVFLGDSITEGCFELGQPNEPDEVYHKKLQNMLQNLDVKVVNAGIGGNNVTMGYERMDSDVIVHNPDVVVVCFGLNDAPAGIDFLATYKDNLQKIFEKLHGIRTIFMTPNMLNTYVHSDTKSDYLEFAAHTAEIQNNGVMDKYVQAAIEVSKRNYVEVCDCYGEWKKLKKYGIDTTMLLSNHINHPTRAMHQLFADMLYSLDLENIDKPI